MAPSVPAVPITHPGAAAGFTLAKPRQFYIKSALLAFSTVLLIPILLAKSEIWATVYLVFLVVLHIVGPFIVFYGIDWHAIVGNRRVFWMRILGIAALLSLLFLASKGLQGDQASAWFWGSLFAIWALHTGALALLHIRGRESTSACPFV